MEAKTFSAVIDDLEQVLSQSNENFRDFPGLDRLITQAKYWAKTNGLMDCPTSIQFMSKMGEDLCASHGQNIGDVLVLVQCFAEAQNILRSAK